MLDTDPNSLDHYVLNEDPMTCGICGARTDFSELTDGSQQHRCLNTKCGYMFVAVEDSE